MVKFADEIQWFGPMSFHNKWARSKLVFIMHIPNFRKHRCMHNSETESRSELSHHERLKRDYSIWGGIILHKFHSWYHIMSKCCSVNNWMEIFFGERLSFRYWTIENYVVAINEFRELPHHAKKWRALLSKWIRILIDWTLENIPGTWNFTLWLIAVLFNMEAALFGFKSDEFASKMQFVDVLIKFQLKTARKATETNFNKQIKVK